MKVLKKLVIGVVIFIAVLWIGLYVAVKIVLPPEKIKALAHEHGSKALGRDVYVGDASIAVFPTIKVSVNDVTLANAEGFSAEPMFQLKQLALAVDFMSIVRMSPVIKEIRLVEPSILYEVDKQGKNNLEGLGKADTAEKTEPEKKEPEKKEPLKKLPAPLHLKSFVIENARATYRDLKAGQEVSLEAINQKASVEVAPTQDRIKTAGELTIASISVSDQKMGLRKGGVRISFTHDLEVDLAAQTVTINGLKLGIQDILIQVLGTVKDFQTVAPGIELKISSNEIKMASLLKEVPLDLSPDIPKLRAQGFAKLTASVSGTFDKAGLPKLNANLTLFGLGFGHADLPTEVKEMNGLIQITANSVEIKDFGFMLGENPVSVAMLITDLLKVPYLKQLNIDAKLDLGKLMALAGKFTKLPEGFSLTGFVESKIQASGLLDPKNPMGLKAGGNVVLRDIVLVSKPLTEKVQINGEMNLNNEKIVQRVAVKLGNSDMNVVMNITDYLAMALPKLAQGKKTRVNAEVTSGVIDLDQLLSNLGSGEKKKPEKSEKPEKPSAPLTAYPKLPDLEVNLNVKLKKTKLLDLEMTDYVQVTSVKDGMVKSTLGGKLCSGSFSQKMDVDLRDAGNAKVGMVLNVNNVEANEFISRINDKLPGVKNGLVKKLLETDNTVYGKYSMDMDVKTNGLPDDFANNLAGKIYVKIQDGKLVGVKILEGLNKSIDAIQDKVKIGKRINLGEFTFKKFDMTLEVRDGQLIVKDCQIDQSPVGDLSALGTVGFDTKLNLTLENHMSKQFSDPILGAQKKVQGTVSGAAGKVAGKLGEAAGGMISLVPQDKNGNAVAYFAIGGTLTDPSFTVDFKRMQQEASGDAKAKAQAEIDNLKAQAEAKVKAELDAKKKAAEEAINKQKAEAEAKVKAQTERIKQETTNKAKEEGKKALRKFGF
jgi:hypothetical protein